VKSLCCKGQECQAKCLHLAFFGFVDIDLETFEAALDSLVDLDPFEAVPLLIIVNREIE